MITPQQAADILRMIAASPEGEPLPKLPKRLSDELNIYWQAHRATPKQKLSDWLAANVPGVHTENNRAYAGNAPQPAPAPVQAAFPELRRPDGSIDWEAVGRALLPDLNEDGVILLTKVNNRIKDDWKLGGWSENLQPGEENVKMYTWAENRFGQWFKVDHNDLEWYMAPRSQQEPAVPLQAGYPLELDPDSPDSLSEVKAMHAFAFMGAWIKLGRRMFALTGMGGSKSEYWRAIIAHKLNRATVMMGPYYQTAPGPDGTPRVAIKLDLNTTEGRPLYMVFAKNTQPGAQPWRLLDCCWPGQAGTGLWLCSALGLQSEEQGRVLALRRQLSELLPQTQAAAETALAGTETLREALTNGRPLSDGALGCLQTYAGLWNELNECLTALGQPLPSGCSLEDVRQWLLGENRLHDVLKEPLARLEEIIRQTSQKLAHLNVGEETPLQADLDELSAYQEALALSGDALPESAGLLEMVDCYGQLARLSGLQRLSESDDAQLEKVAARLGLSPARTDRYFSGEGSLTDYAAPLAELEGQIRQLAAAHAVPEQAAPEQPLDATAPDHLSEIVGRVLESSAPDRAEIYRAFKAPNALELHIINCDQKAVAALLQDAEALAGLGYDEAQQQVMLRQLEGWDTLSHASLPLACANRLYHMERYANRQAEKFWLAALPADEAFGDLAALFRRQDRQADFLCLTEHWPQGLHMAPVEYHYLLKCYADQGEYQKSLSLLTAQPELLYHSFGQESNLELAAYAARQCQREDLVALYDRLALLPQAAIEADELEEAVIALREETAPMESLLNGEQLPELGYTPEQLAHMRDVLHQGEYPTGSADFETGLRLWQFLGARHGLAEQFMWKGVQPSQLGHQMGDGLFPLLASQQRWDEIALLYEAHAQALEPQESCRRAYLTALCRLRPADAAAFARRHLVDAMKQEELLAALPAETDPALNELLARLRQAAQSHEYVRCVIEADAGLRDFALQPARLAELGLDAAEQERVTACYKNDSYPHQQDPASLGLRIYTFLKARDGLAEALARFALPEYNAALLLAHILRQRWDYPQLAQLFAGQPKLIADQKPLYLQTLVHTGDYQTFLALPEEDRALLEEPLGSSFCTLAALMQRPGDELTGLTSLPQFDATHVAQAPEQFAALARRLAENHAEAAFETFIPQIFDPALSNYDDSALKALLTGDGLWDETALVRFQAAWLAAPAGRGAGVAAAISLWRLAGVGELTEFAAQYYDDACAAADELDEEQKRALWLRLSQLYPEKSEGIQGQYLLSVLRDLMAGGHPPEEKAMLAQGLLLGISLSTEDLDKVLTLLQQGELLGEESLQKTLIDMAGPDRWPALAVRLSNSLAAQKQRASETLCCLYAQLLAQDALPAEALDAALTLCERAMSNQKKPLTAACLWALHRSAGHTALAGAAYTYLMSCPSEQLPPELLPALMQAARQQDADATLLEQFFAFLRPLALEELPERVAEYRLSARLFVVPHPIDRQVVNQYAGSGETCTPEEAESILRLYFYARGDNDAEPALALRGLPVGEDEALQLRLSYLNALTRDDDVSWQSFTSQLYQGGEPALWLQVATRRLRIAHDLSTVVGAQQQALSLAGLLARREEPLPQEALEQLADAFCDTLRHPANRHKTLCNLAQFGAETGCYEYILQKPPVWQAYLSPAGVAAAGVFACRLILKNALDPARRLLAALANTAAPLEFRPLYSRLAEKNGEELAAWAAREGNRKLLRLVLPDGQRPSYERGILPELVLPTLESDDPALHQACAEVIVTLMDLFPEDTCLGMSLFLCCKRDVDFEDRLLYLYRAELAMCDSGQRSDSAFISRLPKRQLDDLVLLGCLLNKLGLGESAYGGRPDQARYQELLHLSSRSMSTTQQLLVSESRWNVFLANRDDDLPTRLVVSRLTGDWRAFCRQLFEDGLSFADYADWLKIPDRTAPGLTHAQPQYTVPVERPEHAAPGLTRALLRVWAGLTESARPDFLRWLLENASALEKRPELAIAFQDAHLLLTDHCSSFDFAQEPAFLELPLEERCLNTWLFPRLAPQQEGRDLCKLLMLAVCQRKAGLKSLQRCADSAFNQRRNARAAVCYHVLDILTRARPGGFDVKLTASNPALKDDIDRRNQRSMISARWTLCGLLAGFASDREFVADTTRKYQRQRALNVMLETLNNERAQELPAILRCYPEEIRSFLLYAYRLLDGCEPDDSPASHLNWALRCSDLEERYLCLRLLERTIPRPLNELSKPVLARVKEELRLIPGYHGNVYCPNSFLANVVKEKLPFAQLQKLMAEQAPAEQAPAAPAVPVLPQTFAEPTYAARLLKTLPSDDALPDEAALLAEHERNEQALMNQTLSDDERRALLEAQRLCSLRRYRLPRESKAAAVACLALGVDEWNCLWQQVKQAQKEQKEQKTPTMQPGELRALLDETFFETATVACVCPQEGPEWEAFAQLATSALYSALTAAPDLEALTSLYRPHQPAFAFLRMTLSEQGAQSGESLRDLLDTIREIDLAFQNSVASDEMRLERLEEIRAQFDPATYDEWTWRSARTHLQSLLAAAVSRLRDRPRLSLLLFNEKGPVCSHDSLFGEVRNSGSQEAVDITLHAVSADGALGAEYKLNRLRPGCRAPFHIDFDLPASQETLSCTLTLTFGFGGQTLTCPPQDFTLPVGERPTVCLPVVPYPTDSIMDYALDEEGNVTSRLLFGREREKGALRELVSGSFGNYHDAFVRGFRRAGKTSLLNYLAFYIRSHCRQEGVLPVCVSCQDVNDSRCIHALFVDQVLKAVGNEDAESSRTEAFAELHRRWELPAQAPDRSLPSVKPFFAELSQALGGKKLVLILDELDTLIERFEQDQSVFKSLLASLDGMLDDATLHRYVHFVLCGSNNLIRYQMDGGVLHQAFQRVNTLEVGNLPYQDVRAMLTAPCQDPRYTLQYTEAALEAIYRFTGGAVWHARLMGTALVKKLFSEQRSVVYPSDVCDCISEVNRPENCGQFYEACGLPEKAVLQSLQRYASHLEASATLDEILLGLPESYELATVKSSLELLQQLGVITQLRDSGGVRYRFTAEMYRQYFRSTGGAGDSLPSDDDQFYSPAQARKSSDSLLDELASLL